MTYLLWGLFNIGLLLFFIIICFKVTKLIREKLGLFASIIFVFGLLSFVGHSNNDNNKESNSNQIKTWKFTSEDILSRNGTYLLDVDLEETLVSKYDLDIEYGKDRHGEMNIPISASSSKTGLVIGTNWKPVSIIVNKTNDNKKFEYLVEGVVEWKLLGATIYSRLKEYKGIALIK